MCVSFLSFFKKIGTQTNYRRIIMHMADALVSPAVGGAMLAVSAGLVAYSAHKMRKDFDPSRIPLMGIMGAFVFAAQMINFAIPGTGSSGHIGGAVLLAALLPKILNREGHPRLHGPGRPEQQRHPGLRRRLVRVAWQPVR